MNIQALLTSNSNEWETPKEFFDELNNEFGFTLDPCSTTENHKCDKFYTEKEDGLQQSWANETVFINPPYGREIGKWVKKSYEENLKNNITCVMLIPARTDTQYFHQYIYGKSEIRFIKGRIKFINKTQSKPQPAPFPSMVVIFRRLN